MQRCLLCIPLATTQATVADLSVEAFSSGITADQIVADLKGDGIDVDMDMVLAQSVRRSGLEPEAIVDTPSVGKQPMTSINDVIEGGSHREAAPPSDAFNGEGFLPDRDFAEAARTHKTTPWDVLKNNKTNLTQWVMNHAKDSIVAAQRTAGYRFMAQMKKVFARGRTNENQSSTLSKQAAHTREEYNKVVEQSKSFLRQTTKDTVNHVILQALPSLQELDHQLTQTNAQLMSQQDIAREKMRNVFSVQDSMKQSVQQEPVQQMGDSTRTSRSLPTVEFSKYKW